MLIFYKKSQFFIQFTQLKRMDMCLAKKQPVAAIGSLQGTWTSQKKPHNDRFYSVSKINEK